jgi:hypothetical protein
MLQFLGIGIMMFALEMGLLFQANVGRVWASTWEQASAPVQIELQARVRLDRFELGVGSRVKLVFSSQRGPVDGIFLGRVVESNGRGDEMLILDLQKTRAYLIDRVNARFSGRAGRAQLILRPMDQQGQTCAAYAFTHYWQQYALAGFPRNESLSEMMASERSRTKFLEENISRYYLDRSISVASVMKRLGVRFGAVCKTHQFASGSMAADFVYRHSKAGIPVLIDFFLGPNMVTSTYETVDFEKPGTIDSRLWVPRRKGEGVFSGHAIVSAAAFEARGRRKLLVIDSNWDQPRIWDVDRYLSDRTAAKEIGFTVCQSP